MYIVAYNHCPKMVRWSK